MSAEASYSGFALRARQEIVIEAVGRAIVGGRYAPGSALPREGALAAEYGVSVTTVRGAMTVLAAKGLVEIRRKVGTTVRPRALWDTFDSNLLSWSHAEGRGADLMESLSELRQVMEPMAARLAATRATSSERDQLTVAANAMLGAVDDPVAYPEWDVAFHQAVYSASHNPLLDRFGLLVAEFMRIAFEIQQTSVRDHVGLAIDAQRHSQVCEAIARGDAEGAASAMLEVVLDGKTTLSTAPLGGS